MTPFGYQETGRDFLAPRSRAFLWDDMGVGKTPQAIWAADKTDADEVLVVAPAAVRLQWASQVQKISERYFFCDVNSYEQMRKAGIFARRFDLVVIDEGHKLKNRKAGVTRQLFGRKTDLFGTALQDAGRIWHMTGTPMPNNPSELWAPMHALAPQTLAHKGRTLDYWSFSKRFCKGWSGPFGFKITGGKNLDELADRLAPVMLRRLRTDPEILKDRPVPTIDDLLLDCGRAVKALRAIEKTPEGEEILRVLKRYGVDGLERIVDTIGGSLRRLTGLAKVAPIVGQLLEEFDGGLHKIVVFAFHREVLQQFSELLTKHGIDNVVAMGGMTDKARDAARDHFVATPKRCVYLGQINTVGEGVDGLQHATGEMLFAETSWVPKDNDQAIARLDRQPYKYPVNARFAALAGSLDEAVTKAYRLKTATIKTLFG